MSQQEVTCSVCQGVGVVPGGICPECKGAGFGVLWQGFFLYWGKVIDRGQILFDKLEASLRGGLNFIFLLFGLFGPGFLLWSYRANLEHFFTLSFWRVASTPLLIFWFSLLGDLYLVYRLQRESESYRGIPKIKLAEQEGEQVSATFADTKKIARRKRLNVSVFFTHDALAAIKQSYQRSAKLHQARVEPVHLFAALLSFNKVQAIFSRLGINTKSLREKLSHALAEPEKGAMAPLFSAEIKQICLAGFKEAVRLKKARVETTELLLPTVQASSSLQEILFDLGIDLKKLANAVRWLQINDELWHRYQTFRRAVYRRPKGSMNRAMTALQTRALDRFSDDLTRLAGLGYSEMCVNREKEFEEIFRIFEGERKSIILIGERGTGKDAVLAGLAWRMIEDDAPKLLRDKRLVALSVPKLIAGANASEAAERLLACLYDVARAGNIILAIPDVHNLIGLTSGETGAIDLADVLISELNKGYCLAIATSNPAEYRSRVERTDLGNNLIKVEVPEPDPDLAIQILESKTPAIEYQTKVYFSYDALEKAVTLSARLMHDRFLPQKAIEIIKEAAQFVKNKRGAKQIVSGEDVAQIVSQKTKVPVTAVTQVESEKLLNLESVMHERIVGQDEAIKAVAAALRRARAELRDVKRPIANFLFLGPTGVGKTETAKTVAAVYFGAEERMIRLDMSEYQDKSSIYRLIGAPGESGGLLTEPVRQNPFSLLLLDELEKAHPDILNIFLQVMDDGRITDAAGRVIDFTNAILIATSNAGTQFIQDGLKVNKKIEEIKKDLIERELKQYFRPEFLNRFDGVMVFKPLTEIETVQIARLMIRGIAKQLEAKGIFLQITDEAVVELAQAGFDPLFGARPLRRVIQERVQDTLANFLLTQKIGRRDVVILEKGGVLRVEKARKL